MRPSYFVAVDLLLKSFSFLVIPIYAYVFTPAEMGLFSEWFSFYTLLFGLSFFGINSFVVVLSSKGITGSEVEPYFVRFLIKWWLLILSILLFLQIYLPYFYLEGTFFILPIAAAAFCVIDYTSIKLRLTGSIKKYFFSQVIVFLLIHLLPLAVTIGSPSASVRIFTFTFSLLITALIMVFLFREIEFKAKRYQKGDNSSAISSRRIREFGFPLVILAVGQWFKSGFDLQLLKAEVGYNLAGSLGVVIQLSSAILIFSAVLNRVYSINLYKLLSKNKTQDWIVLLLKLSFGTAIVSAGLFISILLGFEVFLTEYNHINQLAVPIIISSLIYGIACYFSFILFYYEKSALFTGLQLVSALIHIPLSLHIVSRLGPENIGYSSLVSNSIFLIMVLGVGFKIQREMANYDHHAIVKKNER
jgi:O-antigen/teichoic acid export membrane protein